MINIPSYRKRSLLRNQFQSTPNFYENQDTEEELYDDYDLFQDDLDYPEKFNQKYPEKFNQKSKDQRVKFLPSEKDISPYLGVYDPYSDEQNGKY